MTKILVIGDFHGKLSTKLFSKIKRVAPDYIFSPGDFCGNKDLGKLFFKYAYGKAEDEIPITIKKKLERLEGLSIHAGISVIKKLKALNIPIFAIRGNWDPAPFGHDMVSDFDTRPVKKFEKLQDKSLNFVDFKTLDFGEFVLVGGVSSTSPINPKKYIVSKLIKNKDMSRKEAIKFVKELNKNWNIRQKNYEDAFKIAKKLNKPTIFLTHNCPYKTKLDKIKQGPQKGKHYGSYQEKLLIKKYQPEIVICGHMHENFGEDKIDKSRIINCGSAMDGKYKVLNF
jgi:Icc-related predicted phosphoesterase